MPDDATQFTVNPKDPQPIKDETYVETVSRLSQHRLKLEHDLEVSQRDLRAIANALAKVKDKTERTVESNRSKEMKAKVFAHAEAVLQRRYADVQLSLEIAHADYKAQKDRQLDSEAQSKSLGASGAGGAGAMGAGGDAPNAKGPTASMASLQQRRVEILYEAKVQGDLQDECKKLVDEAREERDHLRTQVVVLEQAAETMKLLLGDKANEEESGEEDDESSDGDEPAELPTLGTDEALPSYLRWEGPVPNTRIGKDSLEMIIKGLWSVKTISDDRRKRVGLERIPLRNFMEDYARAHYSSPKEQVTFYYNLLRSCEKYAYDSDVYIFLKVLKGEMTDELYYDHTSMISHLKRFFMVMESSDDGAMLVDMEKFTSGINTFFPIKTTERMKHLQELTFRSMLTMGKDHTMMVDVKKILAETADGDQSEFFDCIRKQYQDEVGPFLFFFYYMCG
jgi:hypothetical protein